MTLQASGAISLSDIQTEWSDTGPVSMSELYKDGGSVGVESSVTTVGSTVGPRGYYFGVGTNVDGTNYYWVIGSSVTWGNSNIGNPGAATEFVSGGFRYFRGAFFYNDGSDNFYQVSRRSETTETVNTDVPTSGTITLSDFYGGRAS